MKPYIYHITAIMSVSSLAFGSQTAAAQDKSYVAIAATKTEDKSKSGGATSEDAVTIFNLTGAYGLGSGFVVGAKYFNHSRDDDFLDNDHVVIKGFGPLLGYYHTTGFFLHGAYLISPEKTYSTSNGRVTYSGGDGYVIDIGKMWELGKALAVGVQFSQSKTRYEEVRGPNRDNDLNGEWSDASFYPYLVLAFQF